MGTVALVKIPLTDLALERREADLEDGWVALAGKDGADVDARAVDGGSFLRFTEPVTPGLVQRSLGDETFGKHADERGICTFPEAPDAKSYDDAAAIEGAVWLDPSTGSLFAAAAAQLGPASRDDDDEDPTETIVDGEEEDDTLIDEAAKILGKAFDERESRSALESTLKAEYGDDDVNDVLESRVAEEGSDDDERVKNALDRRFGVKGPDEEVAEELRRGVGVTDEDEDGEGDGEDSDEEGGDAKINAALDSGFSGEKEKKALAGTIREALHGDADEDDADEGNEEADADG